MKNNFDEKNDTCQQLTPTEYTVAGNIERVKCCKCGKSNCKGCTEVWSDFKENLKLC